MSTALQNSVDTNLSVSGIFSNSHFKRVISKGSSKFIDAKIDKYHQYLELNKGATRKDALEALYSYLLSEYRCEYVYKNFITKKILLGRHSLNTSTLLNEFRVGSSLADLVLINGKSVVYEIKTELDTSERLEDQLADYKKAFTHVYLVTHHSLIDKYLSILKDDSVGVIALTNNFTLSEIREAKEETRYLDITTMFKSLRKEEYSNIIASEFGKVPDVPNMYYFKECLKFAEQIPPKNFHKLMSAELKKRKPKETSPFQNNLLPEYLNSICMAIDPTANQYDRLYQFLNTKIN
ncbi:MAG: hypothetical protein CL666_10495 [Balneola sp.]|nr:hypothetical protein [Balneola sp.]|tara:strand:- start:32808 stop:33689 length:882 start_codon:yes stop_codon:yes gene_type:complete